MTGQQLKNSILQMAVQGKLVLQDPNDEPASVLLERIRKEKERLVMEKKIKPEKNPSAIFRGADNLPYEKRGKEVRCIADEIPFEIPDSWEWARLGEITYNHGQMKPNCDFCYIDIGSIDNECQSLNKLETILHADEAPSRARKIVWHGDILYATVRPYLHNMCVVNKDFSHLPIASTGFAVLACLQGIESEYLFRYLMSPDFDQYANDNENSKGVAYPAINDSKLMNALIPVPPHNEQIRILQKLEAIMPYITEYNEKQKAISSLNTLLPSLLKKSILQEAIQGKLVPQNPDDEPASVLLERIRKEKARLAKEGKLKPGKHESVIFRRDNSHYEKLDGRERYIDEKIPFKIPENWAWTRLGNIIDLISGQDFSPSEYNSVGNGIPYITGASNIENNTVIINRWTPTPKNYARKDDLLIVCKGAGVGKMSFLNYDVVHIARQIMAIRKIGNDLDYIYLFLSATLGKIRKQMQGIIPGISREDLLSLLIPFPPTKEQHRIVKAIVKLFSYLDK